LIRNHAGEIAIFEQGASRRSAGSGFAIVFIFQGARQSGKDGGLIVYEKNGGAGHVVISIFQLEG
jgi:hypothetical protein